nr:MAG TPA: Thrombin inhibitor from mosquito [Caudoviricetes sp.]
MIIKNFLCGLLCAAFLAVVFIIYLDGSLSQAGY